MKLTPQDVLTQQFEVKSKGFDKEEVTAYLSQVAEVLENEILEKERFKKELKKEKTTTSKLEKREDILRDTLIAAQKFSKELKSTAVKETELMLKEAELKSDEIISSAMARQRELRNDIRNLKIKRREVETEFVSMLDNMKELIESYRKEDEEFDKVEYMGK
ncbi:MAG: DivIVA domain-containing protein [bacterium]|nr:DivIVA domain-containing protein [bacterium]